MNRGEVWWALRSPPPAQTGGLRLVLLLSWDAHLPYRDRVTVAAITTRVRGLDAEVALDARDGLYRSCVVNLDTISTILRGELRERVTQLTSAKMLAVERAMHHSLGMPVPCRLA